MTRFVVDENVSPKLAAALREQGHDAVHVNDIALGRTPDPVIMAYAARYGRTVITSDHDFIEHLTYSGATAPSVIKLVQRDAPGRGITGIVGHDAQARRLADLLPELDHRLVAGAAVVLDHGGATVTRLPLDRPGRHRGPEAGPVRDPNPGPTRPPHRGPGTTRGPETGRGRDRDPDFGLGR